MITTVSVESVENGWIIRDVATGKTRVTESEYSVAREIERILRDARLEDAELQESRRLAAAVWTEDMQNSREA